MLLQCVTGYGTRLRTVLVLTGRVALAVPAESGDVERCWRGLRGVSGQVPRNFPGAFEREDQGPCVQGIALLRGHGTRL
jgi:hypothetical protein